jgi:uncharacterized membrane protein
VGAILAVLIWIFLKNPLYSVVLVAITDFVGFIPTYRKSYAEPWSETTSLYVMSAVSNLLSLLAIANYSLTTALYVSSLFLTNLACIFILLFRRLVLSKNKPC